MPLLLPLRIPLATAVLSGIVLSGCASTTPSAAGALTAPITASPTAVVSPPVASTSPPACPSPQVEGDPWPASVPEGLPKPPAISVSKVDQQDSGLTVVRFSNPLGLRQNVLFVVDQLPAAGFVLGRGDAEATEADAPFQSGDVRGILRMVATGTCTTQWLLAFGKASGTAAPPVPSYTPSASPSPLPFG